MVVDAGVVIGSSRGRLKSCDVMKMRTKAPAVTTDLSTVWSHRVQALQVNSSEHKLTDGE